MCGKFMWKYCYSNSSNIVYDCYSPKFTSNSIRIMIQWVSDFIALPTRREKKEREKETIEF